MGITELVWEKIKWSTMKKRLGYSDEEMRTFREDPRNREVVAKAPEIMSRTIIAEVVDSRGCNSQHHVGDKFYFDGFGNLITARCPKRVCIYALNAIAPQIFSTTELMYAGVDPNQLRFKRSACFDAGLECGGFGRVVMEVRVER